MMPRHVPAGVLFRSFEVGTPPHRIEHLLTMLALPIPG